MESQIDWTTEQWNQIKQSVCDEVSKVSMAGSFLACYGPLERSATVVRSQRLKDDALPITVDDVETLKIWTLAVQVELKQRQLAEENLTGAMSAFRRAANLLARAEDAIVFNGLPYEATEAQLRERKVPLQCRVTGGQDAIGLFSAGNPAEQDPPGSEAIVARPFGQNLVSQVAQSIADLETHGHLGPFACVLGNEAFKEAHTPDGNSLVLPKDRMEPLLGMQLLRTGTLDPKQGFVVSLAGDPIDLVVSTAPSVQFLNVNEDARYLFRVYEKIVLRIKEKGAVSSFKLAD